MPLCSGTPWVTDMAATSPFTRRRWLMTGLALAGLFLVYEYTIAPRRERERQVRARIACLREETSDALKRIKGLQDLELKSAGARSELNRLDSEGPAAPPLVWVPEIVKRNFSQFGFAELKVWARNTSDEPQLPGYRRTFWCINVTMQNVPQQMSGLLLAIAQLEEKERMVRVADIAIDAGAGAPGPRTAVINISTLLRE